MGALNFINGEVIKWSEGLRSNLILVDLIVVKFAFLENSFFGITWRHKEK